VKTSILTLALLLSSIPTYAGSTIVYNCFDRETGCIQETFTSKGQAGAASEDGLATVDSIQAVGAETGELLESCWGEGHDDECEFRRRAFDRLNDAGFAQYLADAGDITDEDLDDTSLNNAVWLDAVYQEYRSLNCCGSKCEGDCS
jgi:hypothetical protein